MAVDEMKELIELSHRYGGDSDYVMAGGGNTSLKAGGTLYVKASGHALATIGEDGFAKMEMSRLEDLWNRDYPENKDEREEMVLSDMMSARSIGEGKRPSVEALLHSLLKGKYVVHTHPSLVNGLTCGRKGEEEMDKIFGSRALWIPLVDPGFVLAKVIRDKLESRREQNEPYPSFIFLQNHGIFVAADSPEEIDTLYDEVFTALKNRVERFPQAETEELKGSDAERIKSELSRISDGKVKGFTNDDIKELVEDSQAFSPLRIPFSPDHIVYSGLEPLWLEKAEELPAQWKRYETKWNRPPKSAALKRTGFFVFALNDKELKAAEELFHDALKVALYTRSFGGPLPMTEEAVRFIADWEVEKYRAAQTK